MEIFHKKFTRKEFLLYMLGILIALSGITTLVKTLTAKSPSPSSGFGSGPYGGVKK